MPDVNEARADIQGFITSAYGHTYHAAYLFLRIGDLEQAKAWLQSIIPLVMTAESWRSDDDEPKDYPKHVFNIAVTMDGLRELGLSQTALNSFPLEMQEGMTHPDRAKLLGDVEDSAPENWQVGGTANPDFHFVVILHSGQSPNDRTSIEAYVDEITRAAAAKDLSVVHTEWGYRREDNKEHFGFHDGISQPKILGINQRYATGDPIKSNIVKPGEFILGYLNQYDLYLSMPVVPVAEDPNDILPALPNPGYLYELYNDEPLKNLGMNGTFVVYRKLKQNVGAFWQYLASEVARLDGEVTPERIVWLASKFVGRYPSGQPLIPESKDLNSMNDFSFADDDEHGLYCPLGSHIRRSNPRDQFFPTKHDKAFETVDKHRIMRRGRIFGEALFDLDKLDELKNSGALDFLLSLEDDVAERGLHFFSVNASIQMQFEFIQDSWASNPHFNTLYENRDPLIGDNDTENQRNGKIPPSRMRIPAKPAPIRTTPLPRFVDVLGGAYLFMPSLTALRFFAN